jgi:hypothetical protein
LQIVAEQPFEVIAAALRQMVPEYQPAEHGLPAQGRRAA